ncbi:hypothetical protein B0I33_10221 [Prauserella shujinwangii]|uniref:Uncharacterized protein n=1 Tax=Prauserella shujinwangii TaxID=1453103 RepID=A0A2T0LZZ9_9PSEU|nr:hypothetical protein [Prauserella shujinwangii]PRX49908.1 hypothetical protein B0I33_10221 [Prauserella shujinwangii]
MGHPHHFPGPPRPAGMGTALTAGIIAMLTGAFYLIGFFDQVADLGPLMKVAYGAVGFFVTLLCAGGLGAGGIMLLTRKRAGQTFLAAAAGLATVGPLALLVWGAAQYSVGGLDGRMPWGLMLVPGALVLVLTLLPATRRWLAEGQRPPAPPWPGQPFQQQGWPGQPGPPVPPGQPWQQPQPPYGQAPGQPPGQPWQGPPPPGQPWR